MVQNQEVSFDFTQAHLQEGNRFSSGYLFQDIGTGETLNDGIQNMYIKNPSNSGVMLVLDAQIIRTEGKIYLSKVANPTIDTSGTSLDIVNKHIGFLGNSSQAVIERNVAYSGGTSFNRKLVGGQSGANKFGSAGEGASANMLPPGGAIVVEVENESGNTIDISLDQDWTELRESAFTPTP